MTPKLNSRTIGKVKAAYPESEAIASLATQVARLERALREAEDIGNAACREAEKERDEARASLEDVVKELEEKTRALEELAQADQEVSQFEHLGDVQRFARAALLVRASTKETNG